MTPSGPTPRQGESGDDESRKLRRLQIMVNMVMSVIAQDPTLAVEEAASMVADARRWRCFPAKSLPGSSSTTRGCNG